MRIAATLGERTSCVQLQVGCVFVDGLHRIISGGYNGPPRGDENCCEVGCAKVAADPAIGKPGRCRGAHAEINGIISCIQPERLRGSTLYVTVFPCHACMKALVQAGVRDIVYRDEYVRVVDDQQREREPEALELAQRMGIGVSRLEAPSAS
jgi:dCMP deaminase